MVRSNKGRSHRVPEISADDYDERSILILTQLLHLKGISDLEKLETCDDSLISSVLYDWKNHVSYKMENREIHINTRKQLVDLYNILLAKYEVTNTVELANTVFVMRIAELESNIEEYKEEFKELLKS
jgi:hypothetical protein